MIKLLRENNENIFPFHVDNYSGSSNYEIINYMKEKFCFVSINFDEDFQINKEKINKNYNLDDGRNITIGRERFICPEVIFKPFLIGKESKGIHELIYQSINSTDIDIRRALYSNIVLCGGSSMFPTIAERMRVEILKLINSNKSVMVVAPPERKYSVWIGGSILACLNRNWFSKEEYEEIGIISRI